jgi:hypothetical protein
MHTATSQLCGVFFLQLFLHLIPGLAFSRDLVNKSTLHYTLPLKAWKDRKRLLTIRQVTILGGILLFQLGWLPSMDKSEVAMNTFMWLFVACVHSFVEVSLTTSPDRFLDTRYLHAGGARKVATETGNEIEVELNRCYETISALSGRRTAHEQQDAKRKHDLAGFEIQEAVFELLHVDALEEALDTTCCSDMQKFLCLDVSQCGTTTGAGVLEYFCRSSENARFDDSISDLQAILPDGWCPTHDHHMVIPNDLRRAVSHVRRHTRELERLHFSSVDSADWAGKNAKLRKRWVRVSQTGTQEIPKGQNDLKKKEELLEKLQRHLEDAQFFAGRSTLRKLRCHRAAFHDAWPALLNALLLIVAVMLWWQLEEPILEAQLTELHRFKDVQWLEILAWLLTYACIVYIVYPCLVWFYRSSTQRCAVKSWEVTLGEKRKEIQDELKEIEGELDEHRTTDGAPEPEPEPELEPEPEPDELKKFDRLLTLSDTGKVRICDKSEKRRERMHHLDFSRLLEISENPQFRPSDLDGFKASIIGHFQNAPGTPRSPMDPYLQSPKPGSISAAREFLSRAVKAERAWNKLQRDEVKETKGKRRKFPSTVDEFCEYCVSEDITNRERLESTWADLTLNIQATRELSERMGSDGIKELDELAKVKISQEASIISDRVELGKLCYVHSSAYVHSS